MVTNVDCPCVLSCTLLFMFLDHFQIFFLDFRRESTKEGLKWTKKFKNCWKKWFDQFLGARKTQKLVKIHNKYFLIFRLCRWFLARQKFFLQIFLVPTYAFKICLNMLTSGQKSVFMAKQTSYIVCCIFWPAFVCCALQTLAEKGFFKNFC